jgi:hypothetical protein
MTLGDAEEGRGDRLGCRGELAVCWARAASWLLPSLAGTSCVPRRRTLFAGFAYFPATNGVSLSGEATTSCDFHCHIGLSN